MTPTTNIVQDLVNVLKNAQASGGLPAVKVDTVITLDNSTILKTGLAIFGGVLLAGVISVIVLKRL